MIHCKKKTAQLFGWEKEREKEREDNSRIVVKSLSYNAKLY